MSVYKAINAVQADLAKVGISKDGKNVQQGYAFRGIDAVYGAVAPLLAKHGLCILPRVTARECVERVTAKGTALFYVTVNVEFDLVAIEDGSKHTVIAYGEAMDSGDKATNKAMSAAYKYACLQTFCIPTEGDNDADATTHEVKPKSVSSEVWDEIGEENQAFLQKIADEAIQFIKNGNVKDAVGHVRDQRLNADEQVALNSRFDSKQRAAMKAYIATEKKNVGI